MDKSTLELSFTPKIGPGGVHEYTKKNCPDFLMMLTRCAAAAVADNPKISLPFVLIFNGGEDFNQFVVLLHHLSNMS